MHCEPASSIIMIFGGLTAIAKAAGVTITSAQRWRLPATKGGTGGIIPAKYHARLIGHAAELGITLPLAAFVDPSIASALASVPAAEGAPA